MTFSLSPRHMKLGILLPLSITLVTLAAIVISSATGILQSSSALRNDARDKLASIQQSRSDGYMQYLQSIEEDLLVLASSKPVNDALSSFSSAYQSMGPEAENILTRLYITDSPFETGEKQKLTHPGDESVYSLIHESWHPWFRKIQETRGYYDIFLVDASGNLVYTVFKELDYATSLTGGKWKDTGIADIFRQLSSLKEGEIAYSGFAAYAPSHGAPASFIGTPLYDSDGNFAGGLLFQMPIDRLNRIIQNTVGMGESGESFIVGPDNLMRSDSRFSSESTILKRKINTDQVNLALKGESGILEGPDHRGQQVLAAYAPLEFHNVRSAVVSEIDLDEIYAPVIETRNALLLGGAILAALACLTGLALGRMITRPLSGMTNVMTSLAGNDLDITVPHTGRRNEIGQMARSVDHFKQQMQRVQKLEQEQEEQKRQAERERHAAMLKLAGDFESSVGEIINGVGSAAVELKAASGQMASTASHTSALATNVASAAGEANSNVETVATATEQLNASISEIGRQVARSSEVAAQAVTSASQTNDNIQALSVQVGRIGEVVSLINDIADQTNLLALNATIEAARAGEAGKGFAVVAGEVKNLASQTARATGEIGQQISEIQSGTSQAVDSIGSISRVITEMHEISTRVAAAVEEQSAATAEIARNLEQAAAGTTDVTENVAGVEQAAQETGSAASQIQHSATELSTRAGTLKQEVERFLSRVRSDNSDAQAS